MEPVLHTETLELIGRDQACSFVRSPFDLTLHLAYGFSLILILLFTFGLAVLGAAERRPVLSCRPLGLFPGRIMRM